jgi:PKD repeat protein
MRILFSLFPLLFIYVLPSFAQVEIKFNVNLSYYIAEDRFDPAEESVDIAGTFNGWGETHTPLSDEDADSVYSITIGGFEVGQTIEYKFRFNNQWGGREEFPGPGNNRVYTVVEGENIISVWYNDEYPPTGPPVAQFSASTETVFLGSNVSFFNESSGLVESVQWFFEGGNPAVSNEENPSVWYSETGSFDVTLIVTPVLGRSTVHQGTE